MKEVEAHTLGGTLAPTSLYLSLLTLVHAMGRNSDVEEKMIALGLKRGNRYRVALMG